MGESFPLISIIVDAKYATDVHYMYSKADNRLRELGRGRGFVGSCAAEAR
jgi:hypothetical protein